MYRCTIIFISFLFVFNAFPFGYVGHKTIARIAEINLNPGTLSRIKPFLEGQSIVDVSIWADVYKRNHRNTSSYHYVNIPVRNSVNALSIAQYYSSSGKYDDDNLADQLKASIEILKDKRENFSAKKHALWFLVHLIGDSQMPLHVGDDNDKGGNGKLIRFFSPFSRSNKGHVTNLHSLWDNLIEIKASEDPLSFGDSLNSSITADMVSKWTAGSIDRWIFDSYIVSKSIYSEFRPSSFSEPVSLERDYYTRMRSVCTTQLQKAGIRLAFLLNSIFSN